jgi:hypothetical protein
MRIQECAGWTKEEVFFRIKKVREEQSDDWNYVRFA